MICNLTEASLHLGYRARSTLQRLVRDGQLEAYRVPSRGRQILLETDPGGLPSLRETVQALTQYRPGSPLWQQPRRRPAAAPLTGLSDDDLGAYCDEHLGDAVLAAALEQTPDWERIAELANASLDCACWGPPPWPADRWATLAMVLSLAEEGAADG